MYAYHPEMLNRVLTVARAVEPGATVLHEPETAAGIGRQAILRDPFRAVFAVNARTSV